MNKKIGPLYEEEDDETYGFLRVHERLLKDEVSTLTFRKAILHNQHLFREKIILDVGCGSGIMSLFAATAGAAKVIAVESTSIADQVVHIAKANNFENIITVIKGNIEEVTLPDGIQEVDVIICDWMSYSLFYGNKLEMMIFARDKWLKDEGVMFPDRCTLYISVIEHCIGKHQSIDWWNNVYGFRMNSIGNDVVKEPFIDYVDSRQMLASPCLLKHLNLYNVTKSDLIFEIPFQLQIFRNDQAQAFITYFEVEFSKCHKPTSFNTGPMYRRTRYKQTIFYFGKSLRLNKKEVIYGTFKLKPKDNNKRGLDITISINFKGIYSKLQEIKTYEMH